ncbi:MAG TPA: MltA domain-containing protein [Pantanalinema sp.]
MSTRLRLLFAAAIIGLSLLGPGGAIAAPAPFSDEADAASLLTALMRQEVYLSGQSPDPVRLGDRLVKRRELRQTAAAFSALVREGLGPSDFEARLRERFELIEAPAHFTGYYLPRLEARRAADRRFRFPLYARPPGLAAGSAAVTRAGIEDAGALEGQGLEIAWVEHELDRYLLMVQGSGILVFEDGRQTPVNYGGGNGHPYVSLGKLLVADGRIAPETISVPAIRAYFEAHPEELHAYLVKNPSYVFFKLADSGPFGVSGVVLTPGRSIATDKALSPSGAIAYVRYESDGQARGRFVCDQDTGSAIKGWGRADIFWGAGDEAGRVAGTLNATGSLTYLLLKP